MLVPKLKKNNNSEVMWKFTLQFDKEEQDTISSLK